MDEKKIISEVLETASQWGDAFNRGDADGCVSYYAPNAEMHAEPVARVRGHEEIRKVWQQFIEGGFSDVRYLDPKVKVISESEAELSSSWTMNHARGVIHREVWGKQESGRWLLLSDHFEILEQDSPE